MKKLFVLGVIAAAMLTSCGLTMGDQNMIDMTLPRTYAPAKLPGEWVSGYSNFTQVVDAYDGRDLGATWQSGEYFKITDDGRNSELYLMVKNQSSSSATKAVGTIRFDVGSTSESGSFIFLALKAHFKGWGSVMVDRDATEQELKNNLTGKYYYRLENGLLRIEPEAKPSADANRFRKLN